jgi:hypothetical protein
VKSVEHFSLKSLKGRVHLRNLDAVLKIFFDSSAYGRIQWWAVVKTVTETLCFTEVEGGGRGFLSS